MNASIKHQDSEKFQAQMLASLIEGAREGVGRVDACTKGARLSGGWKRLYPPEISCVISRKQESCLCRAAALLPSNLVDFAALRWMLTISVAVYFFVRLFLLFCAGRTK